VGAYRVALRRQAPFPGVAVLAYHGIRKDSSPAAAMAHGELHVTAETFDRHMEVLARYCTPISMETFHAVTTGQAAPHAPVLVTFDDGYRSVLTEALPILEKWEIPATVFVCPHFVEQQQRFWFDAVATRPGADTVSERARLDRDEWRRFIADVAVPVSPEDPHAPLSVAEVQALGRHPLIAVGAHTMTHPRLGQLALQHQREEIEQSRDRLTEWLGPPVRWFAYPEGRPVVDFSEASKQLLIGAGFVDGFATGESFTDPRIRRFEQRRFTMLDTASGVELAHRLAFSWKRTA
jgi:peptidoglycan/xylan/chitin deacetylase (PgdA/CDA1 family)